MCGQAEHCFYCNLLMTKSNQEVPTHLTALKFIAATSLHCLLV